jgi:hypothetical protein
MSLNLETRESLSSWEGPTFLNFPEVRIWDIPVVEKQILWTKRCKEFEIEKERFSFRLTDPYREEHRRAAREAAKNE